MSKGVINSITLDKTVILKDESAKVTVDYTASGSGVFTLDNFVDPPSYLQNNFTNTEQQKIMVDAVGEFNGNLFGTSVAISGDYAIIGDPYREYDYMLKHECSAYIFKRVGSSWSKQERITPSNPYPSWNNGTFGASVDIDGNYAIVGAYTDDVSGNTNYDQGAAYIFKVNESGTWTQQQKLVATDISNNDARFGFSVAISGDYAIVGAVGKDNYKGAAYIYVFSDISGIWTQQKKLTDISGVTNDSFGGSVAIDGNYAIVGAEKSYGKTGAAYIYKRDGSNWIKQKYIERGESDYSSDTFGHSVAISGDYAIVGCYRIGNNEGGVAYIFYKDKDGTDNWGKVTKCFPGPHNIRGSQDYFGDSVAIDGNYAIISCSGYDDSKGAAYIFYNDQRDGIWKEQKKLFSFVQKNDTYFGKCVAISGNYAIVGDPLEYPHSSARPQDDGAAYIVQAKGYTLEPPDNTLFLKKLKINSTNWSGETESNYILINTYSGQDSGIMTALYNDIISMTDNSYASGSGAGYVTGSGEGVNEFLNDTKTINVDPGWNIFSSVKSGSISDEDNIIIDHTLQYFNGTSYEQTNENNIEEGKGYMVKCAGSGSFTINYS